MAKKASKRTASASGSTAGSNGDAKKSKSERKSSKKPSARTNGRSAHTKTARIPNRRHESEVPEDVRVPELTRDLDKSSSSDSGRNERAHIDKMADKRRQYKSTHQQYKTAKIGVDTQLINSIFLRVREIRAAHPQIASELDFNQWKIEQRLKTMRAAIDMLPDDGREIVVVLLINEIHRLCDQILIDPAINDDASRITPEDDNNG